MSISKMGTSGLIEIPTKSGGGKFRTANKDISP